MKRNTENGPLATLPAHDESLHGCLYGISCEQGKHRDTAVDRLIVSVGGIRGNYLPYKATQRSRRASLHPAPPRPSAPQTGRPAQVEDVGFIDDYPN
ncbi:hypothetical protein JTB14_012293 [Gonioctena quinquepunctata]|nr:hypothetical protein JTB14_012293 [Gonioctena quinquepunctata]